ncbi:MAG: hypothetical protein MZV70_77290 [Desulfobacterales bacterium]|nr:hypothetical protein [Desulfobacterales bacterium]
MTWSDLRIDSSTGDDSFLISSHLSLDGDSVGSQLAFYWYCTFLGKKAVMFGQDPVPSKFSFLINSGLIVTDMPPDPSCFDALVVLDCSNLKETGVGHLGVRGKTDHQYRPPSR